MIRFKIVSGSLELSKEGVKIFVVGKLSVACNVLSLYEVIPMVSLYNLNQGVTTVVFTGKLSDCEDSVGVPFTVDTFITFVETNLGT